MEKFLKKIYSVDDKVLDSIDFEKQIYKINLKIEKKFLYFKNIIKRLSIAFIFIILLVISFVWYFKINSSKQDINYIVKADLYERLDMYENYDIINNIEIYLKELKNN